MSKCQTMFKSHDKNYIFEKLRSFDWGIREILLAIVFSWNKWLCWLRWYNSEPERL